MSETDTVYEGTYHDGRSAAALSVRIQIGAEGIHVASVSGEALAHWPFKRLVRHSDDKDGPLRLGLAQGGEARLVVDDPGFAGALQTRAPHLFRRTGALATLRLALLLGLLSAAVMAGAYFGLPRAAEALAPLVPPRIEAQIGTRYYQSVTGLWPACTLDERTRKALSDLSARLLSKTPTLFPVTVGIIDMQIENAFALPGGHIVFTRKIVARMESPDELAGVLAHELGHVIERHTMVGVIQQTGMSTLMLLLTGGGSGSSEWALNTAGTLASLSYSRRLEARADARGLSMLAAAGISPAGFAALFDRLQKAEEAEGLSLPPFLSSHPPTPERIEAARAAAKTQTKPALAPEDWAAVKAACVPKKEGAAEGKETSPKAK